MGEADTVFVDDRVRDALAEACRRFRVRRLDVFGSAATRRGFDRDRSDVDLLVTFDPMSPCEYAGAYFDLL